MNAILKSGIKGFFDSMSGLIPVKVLSVKAPDVAPQFDLGYGSARASIIVECTVSEDSAPYKKGEVIKSNSVSVVPAKAILRHQYSSTIGPYDVQPDNG